MNEELVDGYLYQMSRIWYREKNGNSFLGRKGNGIAAFGLYVPSIYILYATPNYNASTY